MGKLFKGELIMEQIPNYKPLNVRLQEEKDYFLKLLEKIKTNLTIPQFKDLQKYLKILNLLIDTRKEITTLNQENIKLFNETTNTKENVQNMIIDILKPFLSHEEIEEIIYVFDIWIINGEPAY